MVKKTNFNAKITEVERKIPNITVLATSSALTAVENKIPDVSSLVKKTEYGKKYQTLKRKLLIMIMTSILLLHNLILWQQTFLMQD